MKRVSMRSASLIIKLNIVFLLLGSCFFEYASAQAVQVLSFTDDKECLSPALYINFPDFQQIYVKQNDGLSSELVVQFNEYELFIKQLEALNGNADDLLLNITDDYPDLNQAVNALMLYEAEKKYPYWLLNHSREVLLMSYEMAKRFGIKGRKLAEFAIGARFHDIGKCLSNPRIINQSRGLTDNDKYEILEHTYESYEIMLTHGMRIRNVLWAAFYHHENVDKTGYPEQLSAEQIPFEAKIIRVADSFSAILGNRPYPRSNGEDIHTAVQEIKKGANTFYDASIVNIFEQMFVQLEEQTKKIKYLNAYEHHNMHILMQDADAIVNHWPLAKVACGLINPLNGEMEYKATNSLGVHRHAEVNLILEVLRENIAVNYLPAFQKISLVKKLTRLEILSYQIKLDESEEAGMLLEDLARQTGSPFKDMTMFTTLRPCDNCLELFKRLGVGEVVFAEEHVDPDFIRQSEEKAVDFRKTGMIVHQAVVSKDFQFEPNRLFFALCMLEGVEDLGNAISCTFVKFLQDNTDPMMPLEDIHNIIAGFTDFINKNIVDLQENADFNGLVGAVQDQDISFEADIKQIKKFIDKANNIPDSYNQRNRDFYLRRVALLKVYFKTLQYLEKLGLLEGVAIYPFMGADAMPAAFMPVLAAEIKQSSRLDSDIVVATAADEFGLDAEKIRNNRLFLVNKHGQQDVDAKQIDNITIAEDIGQRRIFFIKGLMQWANFSADQREQYLLDLEKKLLRPGDRVVFFSDFDGDESIDFMLKTQRFRQTNIMHLSELNNVLQQLNTPSTHFGEQGLLVPNRIVVLEKQKTTENDVGFTMPEILSNQVYSKSDFIGTAI